MGTQAGQTGTAHTARGGAVRIWLLALAIAVLAMVVVGGATRLTDSGLSITEWKPVTGAVPPLSESAWQSEFEKYKQIPEYTQINRGMSLEAFKSIYWWEWSHRFLGRFVGVLFVVPFVFFLLRGWLTRRMTWLSFGAFALGGVQGAVGWWMVSSGLSVRTDVSQYRLAVHLGIAVLIFGYLVWLARQAVPHALAHETGRIRRTGRLIAPALYVQILLGALVAGLDAGLTYPTWPLMDGHVVPGGLLSMSPWWVNFFENVTTVQFDHRMFAYALTLLIGAHAADAWFNAADDGVRLRAALLFGLTLIQAALGITALLHGVPILIALAHQGVAMALFGIAVVHADALGGLRGTQEPKTRDAVA